MKTTRLGVLITCLLFSAATATATTTTQGPSPLPVEIEVIGPGPEERLDSVRVALVELINARDDLTYGSEAGNPFRLVFRFACTGDNPPLLDPDGSFRTACHARLALTRSLSAADARSLSGAEVVYAENSMWVTVITGRTGVRFMERMPNTDVDVYYERVRNDSVADILGDAATRLGGFLSAEILTELTRAER